MTYSMPEPVEIEFDKGINEMGSNYQDVSKYSGPASQYASGKKRQRPAPEQTV